jgi:FkbM family methyltransferase
MPVRISRPLHRAPVEGPGWVEGEEHPVLGEDPVIGGEQAVAEQEVRGESSIPAGREHSRVAKLRPRKIQSALKRRWFERQVPRTHLYKTTGLVDVGSAYGGWTLPVSLIDSSWICYMVGAGGDTSADLELIHRYGVTARSFDAVSDYVDIARQAGAGEKGFSAHHAAIATQDGPLRMQVTHHPGSRSVSAAELYDTHDFIELPGRTLPSLMSELGDERIDLLKLDIEGSEYELMPTLDLRALGVKVFATQLHHTGSVGDARRLIRDLRVAGYHPVACRPTVKLTFVRADLL